jgi:glutamine amidotransferase-like uncharacterized protein
LRWLLLVAVATVTPIVFTACGTPGSTVGVPARLAALPTPIGTSSVPILLFNGTGTSASDVAAVEAILATLKLSYSTANSSQLNGMSETTLKAYKLFIVPGGNSITIGQHLFTNATTNVRNAIQKDGLHYLGICAGGFFGGYSIYNGLNLTSGVWFNFYADYNKGIHKEPVEVTMPNKSQLDIYWENGPQFSGWGTIVGKYPDGTPAIVEGKSGNGWVTLAGVHPEAPASWRIGMKFTTPLSVDLAYAGTLVQYALNGSTLPHY